MRMSAAQRVALFHAAVSGDVATLEALFQLAAVRASVDATELLIARSSPSPIQREDDDDAPWFSLLTPYGQQRFVLIAAVLADQWEVVQWFLSPERVAYMPRALLYMWKLTVSKTMGEMNAAMLELLVEARAELLSENEQTDWLNSLVYDVAVTDGDGVQILLAHGAQVHSTQAMTKLACSEDAALVDVLANEGAFLVGARVWNPSRYPSGVDAVRRLLQLGVDWGAGSQTLETAVQETCGEMVECVVKQSYVDIEARDHQGRTPLIQVAIPDIESWAPNAWRTSVVKVLVEAGANMSARDYQGKTALHHAATSAFPGVVEVLLKHGAQ